MAEGQRNGLYKGNRFRVDAVWNLSRMRQAPFP